MRRAASRKMSGAGFLSGHVLAGHDGLEQVPDAQVFQHAGNDPTSGAGGHRQGQPPVVFTGHVDNFRNEPDFVDEAEISFLLFAGQNPGVEMKPLLLLDQPEDVPGRHPAQGVEAIAREIKPVLAHEHLPGPVVQRHRVGQGAVKVEDEAQRVSDR